MPARHYHLVFVGDSLTAGGRWHEWFTGCNILERGLSGDMTQGIAHRLPEIIRHQPSVIVLEGGINDVSRGDTAEMVATSLQRIIADIHRQLPHARIVLQSIYPVNPIVREAQGVNLPPNMNATIQQVNAALSKLPTGQPYVQWVDVNHRLADKTGALDSRYAIDGVHINAEGYRIVADALRPYVEP